MKLSVPTLLSLCLSFLALTNVAAEGQTSSPPPAVEAMAHAQSPPGVVTVVEVVEVRVPAQPDQKHAPPPNPAKALAPVGVNATPASVLEGLLAQHDMRYITFLNAMNLMKERGLKIMVETGTARNGMSNCGGDGCSTVVLSRWAASNPGMTLASVDIDQQAVVEAASAVNQYPQTKVVCSDSIKFLREYPEKIDFLYLDSYDFDGSNPNPSQRHHLKEIVVAYDKLHNNSVVMVDDCGLIHGGKCELVEIVLKELGWKVVMKHYQLLMVKDPQSPAASTRFNQLAAKNLHPIANAKTEEVLLKALTRIAAIEKRLGDKDTFMEELTRLFQ